MRLPFYAKVSVSTRIRNFESSQLKVNDANGNPIEIAAVVVWRVFDTAEALQRWAKDDLRSLNAQIEFVLRESLRKSGRLRDPGAVKDADK